MDVDNDINIEPLNWSCGLGRAGLLNQIPPDLQHATGVNVQSVCAPDSFSIDFFCFVYFPLIQIPPNYF